MRNGPIVVTGANGIVGRAVLAALRESGASVVPVVRDRDRDAETIAIDLARPDADLVSRLPRPIAVVHLAAAVPHTARHGDTEAAAAATRQIDATVQRACEAWRCFAIYASTCGLYDRRDAGTKDETAEVFGISPYFCAKLDGERVMFDLPETCVMRISAPVGSGLRRGVVLAKFIERARDDRPIEVWGSGRREQDFVAAEDIASFVIMALERRSQGIFNVASGIPVTMRELAETVVKVVGRGSVQAASREDPLDGEVARYSIGRAKASLGWHPRVSLRHAIRNIANDAFPA